MSRQIRLKPKARTNETKSSLGVESPRCGNIVISTPLTPTPTPPQRSSHYPAATDTSIPATCFSPLTSGTPIPIASHPLLTTMTAPFPETYQSLKHSYWCTTARDISTILADEKDYMWYLARINAGEIQMTRACVDLEP